MSVVAEISRRNVFRVGTAYLVASWLIIQVAQTLFPLFGFGDAPTRIIVIVLAIGFIPALVLAWVFRWTPGGLRKESEFEDALPADAGRRLDRLIMVALTLALGIFAIDRFVLDRYREIARDERVAGQVEAARRQGRTEALVGSYGERSIVVLPFANLSEDPGNEYFADGIADELLNLLSRIPELRVISRSSAFSYKGKDIRPSQIAAELNVAHVLEGSVRKSGNDVRISVQLIDARSDTSLWAEIYDRRLDDIFAVQEEIAQAVAERMKVSLLGELPRPTATDPQAYALYLRARAVSQQNSEEGYVQAIELLEQALAIDPNYPRAWDALAGNYLNQASKGLIDRELGFEKGRDAAETALAIDPAFAPAHARLAWVAMLHDNNLALAARHYQRALEMAPTNVRIIGDVASLMKSLGRMQKCVLLDEFVVVRDPVNPTGYFNLGGSYLFAGRYDDAIAAFRAALQLSPNRIGAHYQIGIALLLQGDSSGAMKAFESEQFELLQQLGKALAMTAAGDHERARIITAELAESYEQDAAYNIAYVLAYRGDTDAAFEWLEKAIAYGDPGLADIVADPLLANLRKHPRWLPLLESIGKAPAQLDAINLDVRLPRS